MKNKENIKNGSITSKISLVTFIIVTTGLVYALFEPIISGIIKGDDELLGLAIVTLIPISIFCAAISTYYYFIYILSRRIDNTKNKKNILKKVILYIGLYLPILYFFSGSIEESVLEIQESKKYEYTIGDINVKFPKEYGSSWSDLDYDGKLYLVRYTKENEYCTIEVKVANNESNESLDDIFKNSFKTNYERDTNTDAIISMLEEREVNGKNWRYYELFGMNEKYSMHGIVYKDKFYSVYVKNKNRKDPTCEEDLQRILKSIKFK